MRKRYAIFVRTLGNGSMTKGCREQAPDVFHQEEARSHDLYVAQELPQQRAAWILRRASLSRCAERLARRATYEYINLSRSKPHAFKHVLGVDRGNVTLEYPEIPRQSASTLVGAD